MNTDIVVIGAGGMGSAAAYHLAKAGRTPLLLSNLRSAIYAAVATVAAALPATPIQMSMKRA
ncbi:MAG: FAD-binding protein [Caldilineaceae bacterium]